MLIEGSKTLNVSRETVWNALNDTEFLRQSIPGCRSVTENADGKLDIQLTFAIGPIKASFTSQVEKKEVQAPVSYVLEGKGSAGAAGSGSGTVRVVLSEIEGGTLLDYSVETQVTGRIAQLGSRMIDSTARRFAEDFFANASRLLNQETQQPEKTEKSVSATPLSFDSPAPQAATISGLVWKVALACAVGTFLGNLVSSWIL